VIEPVYYFGVYVYGATTITFKDHPSGPAQTGVGYCEGNEAADFIGYGTVGLGGAPGANPIWGACCVDATCILMTEEDCLDAQGTFAGDYVLCDPDPCAATPVRESTWGRIKNLYR
jgi:hypothetical protein